MDKNQEIILREKVRELKHFYMNLLKYSAVCVFCVLVWLGTGGAFWPIWVIIGCSAAAGFQAFRLGQLTSLNQYFPFMAADWEEKQFAKMSQEMEDEKKKDPKSDAKPKKIPSASDGAE